MYWVTFYTNHKHCATPWKINGQLAPEVFPAVVTYSDWLMSCRSLYWVTGAPMLKMWAPDCCLLERGTPVLLGCPWSLSPSIGSQKPQREAGPEWWTSSAGEHPRRWYLIRLSHPSTARKRMKKGKRTPNMSHPSPQTERERECVRGGSSVSCYPLLLLLFLFWYKSWATWVEIWGGWEKITRPTRRLSP